MSHRSHRMGTLLVAFCLATVLPVQSPAQQASQELPGPDTVRYAPSRGPVVFAHAEHAKTVECSVCHHESRSERPYTKPRQACGECHLAEPAPPVTTSLRNAFHNTATRTGTCYDCHKKEVAAGKDAPTACNDCHKR